MTFIHHPLARWPYNYHHRIRRCNGDCVYHIIYHLNFLTSHTRVTFLHNNNAEGVAWSSGRSVGLSWWKITVVHHLLFLTARKFYIPNPRLFEPVKNAYLTLHNFISDNF